MSSPDVGDYSSCVEDTCSSSKLDHHNNNCVLDDLYEKVKKELIFRSPPYTIPSTHFYEVSSSPSETARLTIRTDSKQHPRIMSVFFALEQYEDIRDSILLYSKELFSIEKNSTKNQLLLHSLLWARVKSVLQAFKFTKQENVHEFMQVGTHVY